MASEARICSDLCHAVIKALRNCGKAERLGKTLEALKSNLEGTSTELDGVVGAASGLRKAIMPILAKSDWTEDSFLMCSIVFQIGSLVPQYVGDLQSLESERLRERSRQRIGLTQQLAGPLIKSVTYLTKQKVVFERFSWHTVDRALRDCETLTRCMEMAGEADNVVPQNTDVLIHIEVSNAYWAYFLWQRQKDNTSVNLESALRRSVEVITKRSSSEMTQGFLSAKLEQLAMLFERRGDWQNAANTCAQAVLSSIDGGSLEQNMDKVSSFSLAQLLATKTLPGDLVRSLKAHVRVTCLLPEAAVETQALIDCEGLDPAQRGFLLEVQLQVLVDQATPPNSQPRNRMRIRRVSELLMNIYEADGFPLRRLRTIAEILRIQISDPSTFDAEFIESLRGDSLDTLNNDIGLERFSKHYKTRVGILFSLLDGLMNAEALSSWIRVWQDTFKRSKSTGNPTLIEIDDFKRCVQEFELVSNFLHMQGLDLERITVLSLNSALCELYQDADPAAYIVSTSELAFHLVQLGYVRRASAIIEKANQTFVRHAMSKEASLIWHLRQAEHYTESGQVEKSQQCLEKVDATFRLVSAAAVPGQNIKMGKSRLLWIASERLAALSFNATAVGTLTHALYLQRRCVKMTYALWELTKRQGAPRNHSAQIEHDGNLHSHVATSKSAGQDAVAASAESARKQSPRCTQLWPLVPRLFSRLLRLSKLLSHNGLHSEALHYLDEASKIAETVHADRLIARAQLLHADFEIMSGNVEQGLNRLKKLRASIDAINLPILSAEFCITLSKVHALRKEDVEELEQLQIAHGLVIKHQATPILSETQDKVEPTSDLAVKVQALSLNDKKEVQTNRAAKGRPIKSRTLSKGKGAPKRARSPLQEVKNESSVPPSRLATRISRLQAANLTRQDKLEEADRLLDAASTFTVDPLDAITQAYGRAENMIRQTLLDYSTNPVFSLLRESTTSYPSIAQRPLSSSEQVGIAASSQSKRQPPNKAKIKPSRPETLLKSGAETPRNQGLLSKCFQTLIAIHQASQSAASVALIHKMADLLCRDAMMLSVTHSEDDKQRMSATFVAYAMEMGRSLATLRESSTIATETILASEKELGASMDHESALAKLPLCTLNPAKFQAEYIDILPETWTAISVSTSDDREELRLSKFRACQPPFVLSIPLARHSSQDLDEDGFGFEQCMSELSNFIELANFSTHSSEGPFNSAKKKEWWEARSAMDSRLQDLLSNVENLWLGGFRGIFAHQYPPREQLSRFQKSFYSILDKHLPSRRKVGKGPKASPVSFDPRILELFVGLGHPKEIDELETSLMDLLYFVVDILQFHGERNAYDEIDFDAIVIEVTDMLTLYHEAVRNNAPAQSATHTLLVLDKTLHSFPWESLPCLAGQAVSRLPSLVSLRSRILLQQQQQRDSPTFPNDGLYINPTDGAYVLNPAGDLTHTEATLHPYLSKLPPKWSSTFRQAPTESEITTSLSSCSLYLYFGHGSGAQYVRARRIRRLEQCAVALLMGCSSGAVTAAGAFESYGTPLDYLFGGAPAVVGTLWDVTDKDIDRFSVRCLERWGLFSEKNEEGKSPTKKRVLKGGNKVGAGGDWDASAKGKFSFGLDEAVSDARQACILRYLNGAAPVMYGIPVYLWPKT